MQADHQIEPCIMSRWGCVRTNRIIICWGETQNLQWSQTYVVTFTHNTRTLTDTHARTHTHGHTWNKVWADNEEDLTSRWDVMFISLPLPPTIPPDHNSLCPDKPREGERKTERPGEENGEVKKEGATHRPHNGCGISYIANTTHWESGLSLTVVCMVAFGLLQLVIKDVLLKIVYEFWQTLAPNYCFFLFVNFKHANLKSFTKTTSIVHCASHMKKLGK